MRFLKEIFIKIIYVFLLIYLIIFIPKLFGYNPLVVISGSMEPTLKVGGLLYYEEIDINDFKEKDILVYELKDHIISHRVVEHLDNGFITKGDANQTKDMNPVNYNNYMGKVVLSIPVIGGIAQSLTTGSGKIALFCLIAFILLLEVLGSLLHKVEFKK